MENYLLYLKLGIKSNCSNNFFIEIEVIIVLKFSDFLYILWISFLKIIIVIGCFIAIMSLISFNHSLGIFIADSMEIPHDLALTITSFGFVNNVTVVFTVFELEFIVFVLSKFKIINNIFNFAFDFLG